jgi:CelD/BcsL family acetyltransferase involved in cellulose biosynthesis
MTWLILPAEDFSEYRDKWDALNRGTADSPVLNSAFVAHCLGAFGTGDEYLTINETAGDVIAMSIIHRKKFGVWDTWQPSQSPVGLWITKYPDQLQKLLGELANKLPGIVLRIGITQQDPAIYPRPQESRRISTLDYIQTANIPLDTTYEAYWSARGKNLRHNMKRQRNRLEKEGVNTALMEITEPGDVLQAIADYGELENAGWKSFQGTAVQRDNVQGKFYARLLVDFCLRDHGAIYQYYYGPKMVASDICIKQGGTFVILKTTYDESIKTSSPAFLMRQELFRRIFSDRQITSIEFYGKVMDWHTKWADHTRTLYHLNYRAY